MATAKLFSPKVLAGLLEKEPEEVLANLKLDHDVAALMFAARSPYFQSLPEELRGQETYLAALEHSAETVTLIPFAARTPEVCLAAVKKSGGCFTDVPERLQTAEMARRATEDGFFSDVPDKFKTPELCKIAISIKNNYALSDMPENMVTPEMCLEAVRHSYANLSYVPNRMLTVDMCMEVARHFKYWADAIPNDIRAEVYLAVVRQNGWNLKHVPKEYLTPELCFEAVRQVGEELLSYVPKKMRSPELYTVAKEATGDLASLPEALKTPELCLEAVRKSGSQLRHVPDVLKTPEMCRLAVMDNDDPFLLNMSFVPERFKTPELCLLATEHSGSSEVIKYVPLACITEELLNLSSMKADWYVKALPHSVITNELLGKTVWFTSATAFLEQFDITLKTLCHYLLCLHMSNYEEDERGVLRDYYPKHVIPPQDRNSRNATFWFLLALCGYRKSVLPGDIDISAFLKQELPPQKKAVKSKKDSGIKHLIKALEADPSAICRLKGLNEDIAALIKAAGHPSWDFIPEELKTLRTLVRGCSPDDLAFQHEEALRAEAYWLYDSREERMGLLRLLPESEKTPDIVRDVVQYPHYIEPELLRELPEHLLTDELVAAHQRKHSLADLDLPAPFLKDQDYRFAIECAPMDLERVPAVRKTPALCMYAVQQDGKALQFVPQELITEDMCLLALGTANLNSIQDFIPAHCKKGELAQVFPLLSGRGTLDKIPRKKRTKAVWRSLAMSEPSWLQKDEFPEELRTLELCMTIVAYNGYALEHVPEEFRTKELCLTAILNDAIALSSLPEEQRTRELCMAAVANDGRALQYVPEDLRSEELCLVAVASGDYSLSEVPEGFRTPELCSLAVEHSALNLEYVPDELKTMELCLKANSLALWNDNCIPERLKTPEFYSAYVKNWWGALSEVPQYERTEQMYLDALEHYTYEEMPDTSILTPRLAFEYLRKNGAEPHNILYESPFILQALTLMRKRQERISVKKNVKNPDYWFAIGIIHGSGKVPASIPAGQYEFED